MASNTNRDDFTRATKRAIERQARGHCSNPACRRLTHGATSDGTEEMNIGVASHICAAARGGPRYDENMTPEQRRSAENGIWLCQIHAHAVDTKDSKFTVEELHSWKRQTNEDSWRSIMQNLPYGPQAHTPTPDVLKDRLRAAAAADLEVFRRTTKWPATTVALTLRVALLAEALSTRALAKAVATLDDLVLVAAPGMGKTTTLFQIAEELLRAGGETALVVPLGDWATEGHTLLASILGRPAFTGLSEADLRTVAASPGVVLLLDGWNELDAAARGRARVQIENLKAELPELGLLVSTRRQVLDVPFIGTRVDLLPLNDVQQMEIAVAMRGDAGAALIDHARRTAGVRDLMSIPLYLTALLSLPDGAPFPATKEEVLRRFVSAHEEEARRTGTFHAVLGGFQQEYLDRLAVCAITTANTSVSDANARRSISETMQLLVNEGQITVLVQPDAVLDRLVSSHVLVRSGDSPGYSFQHQQFQEWYASHQVERLMGRACTDGAARERLKAEVLNQRQWEEAILFAAERSSRGNAASKAACGEAILAAFEVDPMLAAEMIFRATDEVWSQIGPRIDGFVRNWHTPGTVDRAARFMIMSGRPEFGELLWPLLTNDKQQTRFAAMRSGRRFRPSVLGDEGPERIAALPREIRKDLLNGIALDSGVEGLDLATALAKADGDPQVKVAVVEALSFRRADRHIADLLSDASDAVYDVLAQSGSADDVAIEGVQRRLKAARARRSAPGVDDYERLRVLLHGRFEEGRVAEIADIVAVLQIDQHQSGGLNLLHEVRKQYSQALADGLLRRVRENRSLFYGADDILASSGILTEDEALLNIALRETPNRDDQAEAAASVLGPNSVGVMIDAYLAIGRVLHDAGGRPDQAAGNRYIELRTRLGHTPGPSLLTAIQHRSTTTDGDEIEQLAALLSRDAHADDARARPFDEDGLVAIRALAQDWGERLLASGSGNRSQTGAIATLISHVPSPTLLPILKRLLDDNLRRYQAFREEAKANGWRPGRALDEARWPHTHEYQRAFIAIRAPETGTVVRGYLAEEHFGELAGRVLAAHWSEANEPKGDNRFRGGVDFSHVADRRAARASDPDQTSAEAEAIFGVVDALLAENEERKALAVALGVIGARLPHGRRQDTLQRLMTVAPRQARAMLLLSLILSGEDVDIGLVAAGISETFEAAKKEPWILTQSDAYQLRDWLRLLPFATPVSEIPAIVRSLPEAHRSPHMLEEIVEGLGKIRSKQAEDVLFKLAEDDPRLYLDYKWRSTVLPLGTLTAARRIVDLTIQGSLGGKSVDGFDLARELGELIFQFPEIQTRVYEALESKPPSEQVASLLAMAVAQAPGTEDLVSLIDLERKTGRSFVSWQSIRMAVTEHVPSENWKGASSIVPVAAIDLRRRLLEMTTTGRADDLAARCLNAIDKIRDEYGVPESEPRHPDLASGKPWPLMTADSDTE
jgi:hypothetical protein